LPGSRAVDLRTGPYSDGLRAGLTRAFVYSDCWVDDARLVVANALDAAERGTVVLPHTACTAARREGKQWRATLRTARGDQTEVRARALVNVTGPWAKHFLDVVAGEATPLGLKLVQGSHIVVPRLYAGEHAFILQNDDRRVIFVYSYERDYTLIGTTDIEHSGEPGACQASREEIDYLCRAVNRYFARAISPTDVVWAYCGVRPLFDDGSDDPSAVSRDYTLRVDGLGGDAPLLSILGGKITTYRKLAEQAVEQLSPWLRDMRPAWTESAPLPGGELGGLTLGDFVDGPLRREFPWVPAPLLGVLARRHGALAASLLKGARSLADLGTHFGADLYSREVDYLVEHEWARTADDVLWRRTKAGLHLNPQQIEVISRYLAHSAVR
ncbi:MAG: glycerol-3-phosphate dehydrogenase, partial [Betaproteobacteria bacterium]|nr:glycerol-3-phosphate dehydrogenase [Betaproteobacteria bacterium]